MNTTVPAGGTTDTAILRSLAAQLPGTLHTSPGDVPSLRVAGGTIFIGLDGKVKLQTWRRPVRVLGPTSASAADLAEAYRLAEASS